jgi:hypothetical protein
MVQVFNFEGDSALPAGIGAMMHLHTEARAAAGLISPCGKTHRTAKAMALYDAGESPHGAAYIAATFGKGVMS